MIGLSPDYAADHSIFLGTRQGDIYRSKSAGDAGSWEHVGNAGSRVRSLAFSPSFPAERVLYAGTEDGVVESADAGATWSRTGPSGVAMLGISPGYAIDGTLFAGTDAALFVTRDKAQTWTELTVDRLGTGSSVEAVVVSPAYDSDGTLLVSITGEGLYRSTDGGASFSAIGLDLIEANRVIADFTNPTETPIEFSPSFERDRTVFAYANQDVLRSTDAGETWEVLRLPAASTVFSLDGADGKDDVSLSSRSHGTSRRAVVLVAGLAGLAMLSIAATIYGIRRHAHASSQKAS